MSHSLRDVLDCVDPRCKCNDWLEKQTPRVHVLGKPGRPRVPIEHKKHPSITAYVNGCRCAKCRKLNAQRVARYREKRNANV